MELDLIFNEGLSPELDLLDAAIHYNVIAKAGAWLSFDGQKIAQGREQALGYLKENPDVFDKIRIKIRQQIEANKLTA